MSEPQRPPSLPADARWQPDRGEFLVCDQVDGLDHGEAKYYRPDGTLACTAHRVHGVSHGPYERVHPDGTWSQRGTMRHGQRHGLVRWRRTDAPTTEQTVPDDSPAEIRETSVVFVDGRAMAVRFWDAAGVERIHTGPPMPPRPPTVAPDAGFLAREDLWFAGLGSQEHAHRHGWWRWWRPDGTIHLERCYWRGTELESRTHEGNVIVRRVQLGRHECVRQRRIDGRCVDDADQPLPERPAGVPTGASYDLDTGTWVEGPDIDWAAPDETEPAPRSGRYVWWVSTGVRDHERVYVDGANVYDRGYYASGAPMVDRVYDRDRNELSVTWWGADRVKSRRDRAWDEHGVRAERICAEGGGQYLGVRDGDGMKWTFEEEGVVVAEGRVVKNRAVGRWTFVADDARYVIELDGKMRAAVDEEFDPSWILGACLIEREGSGPRIPLLDGVDAIPWAEVEGAFGRQVVKFPTLLQAMTSPIAAVRRSARGAILGEIEHQGSIYPATAAVMPFLIRLLHHPNVDGLALLQTLVYVVEWAAGRSEDEDDGDLDGDLDEDLDEGDDDEDLDGDDDDEDLDGDDDDNPYLRAARDTVKAVADGFDAIAVHLAAHPEQVLTLAAHAGEPGRAQLVAAVHHPDPAVAAIAVHGLAGRRDTTESDVRTWIGHPDPLVQLAVAVRAAQRFGPDTPEPAVDVLLAALHPPDGLEARYRGLPFVDGRLIGAVAIALANVRTPRAMAAAPVLAADLDRLDLFTLDTLTNGLLALCFGDGTGPFAPDFLDVLDRLGSSGQLRNFANFTGTARRWNLPSSVDGIRALAADLRATPDPERALRTRMSGDGADSG